MRRKKKFCATSGEWKNLKIGFPLDLCGVLHKNKKKVRRNYSCIVVSDVIHLSTGCMYTSSVIYSSLLSLKCIEDCKENRTFLQ